MKRNFFTAKELKPAGWLRRQLEIQAEGLSGNLDKVWPDVRDSAWIGGDRDGWERVPYWLDGFIPLAYLLENEDMIARAQKYVDAILSRQRPDGWICPCKEEEIEKYDSWAVQLISKVLVVYYECSGDDRIPDVVYKILRNYYELLSSGRIKLFDWGKFRWYETFVAIQFVYDRVKEDWLIDLGRILKKQGADYAMAMERWKRPLNRWRFDTHIVNLCMMLKSEAVSYELFDEEYTDLAETFRTELDRYNGTPVGLFTGDECLSGLSPIQGTELCAVVEQMYSYELLYAATGDSKWAERLEKVAFNALPATISDDMWTHQYVQMSNQISCEKFHGRSQFRTNNDEAHLFGLEPNYGCCTANFNQGWPKFALSGFLHEGDTVISAIPLPSKLTADGISITLDTNYPFENSMVYHVAAGKAFTLQVRIPSFAKNLCVNGEAIDRQEVLAFEIEEGHAYDISISFSVSPRMVDRPHDLKTVEYGSLVFSLPISYRKIMREYEWNGVERKFPYCDYEYKGITPWSFGYTEGELTVEHHAVGDVPFSSEHPAVTVKAWAKPINWGLEDGFESVCAKVPASRTPVGSARVITLYPYGSAKLRMTELPLI